MVKPPGSRLMTTLWRTPSEMMKKCKKRREKVDPCPDGVEILRKKTVKNGIV